MASIEGHYDKDTPDRKDQLENWVLYNVATIGRSTVAGSL